MEVENEKHVSSKLTFGNNPSYEFRSMDLDSSSEKAPSSLSDFSRVVSGDIGTPSFLSNLHPRNTIRSCAINRRHVFHVASHSMR